MKNVMSNQNGNPSHQDMNLDAAAKQTCARSRQI